MYNPCLSGHAPLGTGIRKSINKFTKMFMYLASCLETECYVLTSYISSGCYMISHFLLT